MSHKTEWVATTFGPVPDAALGEVAVVGEAVGEVEVLELGALQPVANPSIITKVSQ
jgi:hypothetical protein